MFQLIFVSIRWKNGISNWNCVVVKEGENQENEMVDAADAFASNELVGERKIIDKPALPAGFLLQPFKLKEEAPITQKPHDIITSEPIFKQATPLRKLGDMVKMHTSFNKIQTMLN